MEYMEEGSEEAVAPDGEAAEQYVMMSEDGNTHLQGGVLLVDENQQVVGGLPPGQQLVTTEDGQQVLISEDGTQQVLTTGDGTQQVLTTGAEAAEGVENSEEILMASEGQEIMQDTGQQLMTEDGQLISNENVTNAQIVTSEAGDQQILMAGDEAPQVSIADTKIEPEVDVMEESQITTSNDGDSESVEQTLSVDDSNVQPKLEGISEHQEQVTTEGGDAITEEAPMIKLDPTIQDGESGDLLQTDTKEIFAGVTGDDDVPVSLPEEAGNEIDVTAGIDTTGMEAAGIDTGVTGDGEVTVNTGQQIITTHTGQQIIMQSDGNMITADGQQVVLQGPDGQPITPQEGQQLILQTSNGQQIIQSGLPEGVDTTQALLGDDGSQTQLLGGDGQQILTGEDGQAMLAADGTEQVYQTADGQIISAAAAQQLMEGQQLVTDGGQQILGHTADGHPIIGQTESGQQIILQNGQPAILSNDPDPTAIQQQQVVAQMADGQPIYAYTGGDGSGLTPEGHQIIGQTGDGQIIAQLPDGQHIIIPGDQILLAQQQQAAVEEAIKKEAEQNQGVGGDMQQIVIQGANGPVITHVPKGTDMGGTSILRQRDPNDLSNQPMFRTVPAKQRTATSISTPLGKMNEKSKMESLLNQQTIRPTSSQGGRHTIQIPLGGTGNQTIELPTSTGTKTIQLPMNRLMEMLKGSGGAGKTITLVKTPDGRTVTYVLSTPQGQTSTPQPEKRRVGRPPGSVRGPYRKTIPFGKDGVLFGNDNVDDDAAVPPNASRVECEADRLQRAQELQKRIQVIEEAHVKRQAELDRWRHQQDVMQGHFDQKQLEAESCGGRVMIDTESGELQIEAIPEREPFDDVPVIVTDVDEWDAMVPPLSDVEDYEDDFGDVYTPLTQNSNLYPGMSSQSIINGRTRGRPRGRGRGRGQLKMLRINGDRVLSMSSGPGSGKKVMALVTGEVGGKKVIAMRAAGSGGENAVKKIIAAGRGDGARMISVVKTKDGIIRKVLSGGSPSDVKKIIGQSVRVKTPQSRMLQKSGLDIKDEYEDYDGMDSIISPSGKILSVNNISEEVMEGGQGSSNSRVITIKRVDERRRLLAERRVREQQETLAERQRRQLKMDCRVSMEKIDAKVPISSNSIVKVRVSKVVSRQGGYRGRGRGRGKKFGSSPWRQGVDSVSRVSSRKIKRPSRFLDDSTSDNEFDQVELPKGNLLSNADISELGEDIDYIADEFDADDADFDIDNDEYETPTVRKRGRPPLGSSPVKRFKPAPTKIAISPENFSVCPKCKRVYAARKHMLKHFQKEHPECALPPMVR